MSDYAKFVQAVASSTRDNAMDDLLEENRILQDTNTSLEKQAEQSTGCGTCIGTAKRSRSLEQQLVVSAGALQQQTNHSEAVFENVQAQVTRKNIRIIDMEHVLRAKEKELNSLKREIIHKNVEIIHKDALLSILETDRETMQTIKGLGHKREIRRLQGLCLFCGLVVGFAIGLIVSNDSQTTRKTLA